LGDTVPPQPVQEQEQPKASVPEEILTNLRSLDREISELKKQFLGGSLEKKDYENKILVLKQRRRESLSKFEEFVKSDPERARQVRFRLYGTQTVQLLLSGFIGGMIHELTPTFDSDRQIRYPILENIDGIMSGTSPYEVLDELAYAGILKRRLYERLVCCKKCGSHSAVFLRLKCPECGGLELDSSKLIEHLICGTVHEFEAFAAGEQIKCPSCKEPLVNEGEDFRVVGTFNRCETCKAHFDVPAQGFACRACQLEFDLKDATYYDTYSYSLNPDVLAEVKSIIGLPMFKTALEESGYKVELPGTITGSSGMTHNFTLAATKDGKTLVIDFIESENEVGERDLFAVYTKFMDLTSTHGVMVAIPRLSSRAKEFASKAFSKGEISCIEAENQAQAVEQLKLKLQQMA
jgi:hypothetical protein